MELKLEYLLTNYICRACGNTSFAENFLCKDHYNSNLDKEYKYMLCNKCGSLSIAEFYKQTEDLYDESYYSLSNPNKAKISFKDYLYKLLFNLSYIFGLHILLNKEYLLNGEFRKLRINKKSKIVDIGCGDGDFLRKLDFLGYKNIEGVDPFYKKNNSNPFNITSRSIDDINDLYDLIISHHVIEHVENPKEFMRNVKRILKKNGKAIICFPTFGGVTKHFKEYSYVIQAPQHSCLISQNGFEIICNELDLKIDKCTRSNLSDHNWAIISETYSLGKAAKSIEEISISDYPKDLDHLKQLWSNHDDGSNLVFLISYK